MEKQVNKKMNAGAALKQERQRKFFLFLPLVIVPFMTLLLWSMGIVGSDKANAATGEKKSGFNFHLPEAKQSKDSGWNKMQFYAQADKDSAKLKSLLGKYGSDTAGGIVHTGSISGLSMNTDPKEKLIEEKIAALNKKLNEPVKSSHRTDPENSSYENEIPEPPPAQKRAALQRIQEQSRWASQTSVPSDQSDTGNSDPEMQQLDGMLNKVLNIQHPELMQQQLQAKSEQNKKLVYPVTTKQDATTISLSENAAQSHFQDTGFKSQVAVTSSNKFYGWDDNAENISANTIAAVIPEEQVLVNGATVKLKLLNDVYIRGVLIPKNQLLFGTANLKGERLEVNISSIGYNGQILPVALSVYDMDGQAGLYIPGAITRDVAKQSADQGIETMNFGTMDASLGAQAASAGIQAAKSLIGKKIKLVKVTVKSGYRVMLRDMNVKDDK